MWTTLRCLERSRIWLLCVRNWWKTLILRTDILSWSRLLRMHSTWMQTRWHNYWIAEKDVWITHFCGSNRRNFQNGKSHVQKFQRGPTTWKDMLKNAWNGVANWQTRKQSNYIRFPVLAWTTTKWRIKILKNTGELSQVCSHIVLKCLYLALIGRPDILWSVNELAGSVTKWTQACDTRLARLISYIHQTSDYRQCCHVDNTAHHCRLGLFQDSDFAGDLEDPKSTSGGVWCFFGSRTFVPISWMCKKQTSVSHSSTEYDIFRWMLVCGRTVYLRLTCGTWSLKCWERLKEYPNQAPAASGKPVASPKTHPRSIMCWLKMLICQT